MRRMLPLFLLAALPALEDIVIIQASPYQPIANTPPLVVQPSTQSGLADINTNADAYWVTFAVMDAIQGVVQGHGYDPSPCCYAVPVAGPGPVYLSGGFGSPLTSQIR